MNTRILRRNAKNLQLSFCISVLFVLMLSPLYISAQYQPTLSADNLNWKIAHQQLAGRIMGELTVNSTDNSDYFDLHFYFTEGSESIYAGTIREDVTAGKLWYIEPNSTDEKLIFDLELTVNDSFMNLENPGINMHVDSVYEVDGLKIIEFDASTKWNEPIRFIEGVGPNTGLLWSWISGGFLDPYAVCKYEDEVLVYANNNPNFLGCEFDPMNTTDLTIGQLRVYPNPAQDKLTIHIPGLHIKNTIYIVDVYGKLIYQTVTSNKELTLNIDQLSSGIYFLKIKGDDYSIYGQKLIINSSK